jgi:rare lipoprotein A
MEKIIMRYFALMGLAALTLGLVDARPASAAWQCMGPQFACGSSASAKKISKQAYAGSSKKYASQKSRKYATRQGARKQYADGSKATRRSRVSSAVSSSYGGGSTGIASYYSSGTRTASGARFNPGGMTAAHRSLPFGTRVLVTHVATGRSVTVTINDRGPFIKGRIIDLSRGAASALGITGSGLARVSVSVVGRG